MKKPTPINFKNTLLAVVTAGILSIGSLVSSTAWTTVALTASVAAVSSSSAVYADGAKITGVQHCPGYPKDRSNTGRYSRSQNKCKYKVGKNFQCRWINPDCRTSGPYIDSDDKTYRICMCPTVGPSKVKRLKTN